MRKERMRRRDSQDIIKALFREGMAEGVLKDMPLSIHLSAVFGSIISVVRDHVYGVIEIDSTLRNTLLEICWDAVKK
ncbi:MAG: hypothetical protein ABFD62_06370 [Syntrophaceae bacterium]